MSKVTEKGAGHMVDLCQKKGCSFNWDGWRTWIAPPSSEDIKREVGADDESERTRVDCFSVSNPGCDILRVTLVSQKVSQ